MEVINIAVEPRSDHGKGAARKLRRSGLIPAVIYRGGKPPVSLAVDAVDLELKIRRTGNRNTLVRVNIDGEDRICLIKSTQRHPLSRQLLHVDFYEVKQGETVIVKVHVVPVGRAEGTRVGGRLKLLHRWLDVRCLPDAIPASIEVDVTPLDVGDFIRVAEIETPPGVEVIYDANFNVVAVAGKIMEDEEKEGEGEEEGEGEDTETSDE